MALVSTCPHCRTSFRVVADQLKLHRGLVRCGRCGQTFSGFDHLRHVDDAQLRRSGEPVSPSRDRSIVRTTIDPLPDESRVEPEAEAEAGEGEGEGEGEEAETEAVAEAEPGEIEPGSIAVAHEDRPPTGFPDEVILKEDLRAAFHPEEFAADDLRGGESPVDTVSTDGTANDPAFDTEAALTSPIDTAALGQESAIDYFSTRRARGFADRQSLYAGLAAMVLAAILAGQWIVAQRAWIAVQVPMAASLLKTVLAPFGIEVGAPERLDALTIESFELHTSSVPDLLEMRALLRNRASHPVRWPTMQLTLIDPAGGPARSRSLEPADYLADQSAADTLVPAAIPAQTEWPLHLAMRAHEVKLSGYDYRVRLYYHR